MGYDLCSSRNWFGDFIYEPIVPMADCFYVGFDDFLRDNRRVDLIFRRGRTRLASTNSAIYGNSLDSEPWSVEIMDDLPADAKPSQPSRPAWLGQLPMMVGGGIISIVVAGAIAFSGRVITSGENAAAVAVQIQQLIEHNKTEESLFRDMLVKQGELYTRREAQADREASERRFQELANRISDLGRRIEILETSFRFIQQQQMLLEQRPTPTVPPNPRR